MNIYVLTLFLISSFLSLNAQFTSKINGASSFGRFNRSETYFVLSGREELDTKIIDSISEIWNLTTIHTISQDSFKIISKDISKSFIYIGKLKQKGSNKKIKALALVNGGYEDKVSYLKYALAYISIDNEGYEGNDLDISYRIIDMIKQLQETIILLKTKNIEEKTYQKVINKLSKLYNADCGLLQTKTLLIDERYLNQKIVSQSEFDRVYNFEVMFVPNEYIREAIDTKNGQFAYLVSALNIFKVNTITNCQDGKIIYADFEEENQFKDDYESIFDKEDIIQLNSHVKIGK